MTSIVDDIKIIVYYFDNKFPGSSVGRASDC